MDWDQLEASSANLVDRVSAVQAAPHLLISPHHKNGKTSAQHLLSHSSWLSGTCTQDEVGMPRIDRNIDQVQQMSEMMVARIRHRDLNADGLASARLLAQQGLNQRKYVHGQQHWSVASVGQLDHCLNMQACQSTQQISNEGNI